MEVNGKFDKSYFSRVAQISDGGSTIVGSRDNGGEQVKRVITEKFSKNYCFKGKRNRIITEGR